MVQFKNSECIAKDGDNTLGVCVTSNEVRKNRKGKVLKQTADIFVMKHEKNINVVTNYHFSVLQ